ncbi:MAG: 16S rRNA (cytidine(1402)-2'-O)-methyltransferase [Patescibacteria group bacterium]|nr:16S rRNA (cytidine(1402)-2'-O)-methyltransferase [Patescibacteria group bacterium]
MLYIVPTPIGNLEDITFRAINTLKKVDRILCEDTRHSKRLLDHYEIKKPLTSFHSHSNEKQIANIIEKLKSGENIALISDAGTPGISDPAWALVKALHEEKLEYTALPGPTAFVPALNLSGFPTDRFFFQGFLPLKKGRQTLLKNWKENLGDYTIVLYESPHRIEKTLGQLSDIFEPTRQIALVRELTKIHEECIRGSLEEITENKSNITLKGEFVVLIAPENFG